MSTPAIYAADGRALEHLSDLPWDAPLREWDAERFLTVPVGISRHTVRILHSDPLRPMVVKETQADLAGDEYELLTALYDAGIPTVRPLGVVTGRSTPAAGAVITEHLRGSQPYRALFDRNPSPTAATLLVDALAVLLVRLHLAGFYWGDVSLSNTLFRHHPDEFTAFLVDAETGEFHNRLSDGQRAHDLELARINLAGEFFDVAKAKLPDRADLVPHHVSRLLDRYDVLWEAVAGAEHTSSDDPEERRAAVFGHADAIIKAGFAVGDITATTDLSGLTTRIEPKVVSDGYHSRRLHRLTGELTPDDEAQERLADFDAFRFAYELHGISEEAAAARWMQSG